MKKLVMVVLVAFLAAIVPQMTVAAPAARQYTLVQVPVIELASIDGDGGTFAEQYLAVRIRSAVAKSGKAVVAVPGSQIAVTHRFLVTGEAGYYEEDGGRQLAGAVISAVVESALTSSRHSGFRGFGGGRHSNNSNVVDWRKKSAYVDLVLEIPSTATGLYAKSGAIHVRGTASTEDIGINISTSTSTGFRGFSRNSSDSSDETKLFQKAAERALEQLVAGLSKPEKICPITVRSGKSITPGKNQINWFCDKTPIVSYEVLAVTGTDVLVWPIDETRRPVPGDKFDIVVAK